MECSSENRLKKMEPLPVNKIAQQLSTALEGKDASDPAKYEDAFSAALLSLVRAELGSSVEALETVFAPLTIAYAIALYAGDLIKGDKTPIEISVCGCRGLDEDCWYNALAPLLGVPPERLSVTLLGEEFHVEGDTCCEGAPKDPFPAIHDLKRIAKGRITKKGALVDARSSTVPSWNPDIAVFMQPGFQLHREWITGIKALISKGVHALFSSLSPRECRNDMFVASVNGLQQSSPVPNPFAPKNFNFPQLAREDSRWSSLLWTLVPCTPLASPRMLDFVLAGQTDSVWHGFWGKYPYGEQKGPLICITDNHYVDKGAEGAIVFSLDGTNKTRLCGLCVLKEDLELLAKCETELERACWCYCVRKCYLEPFYNRVFGAYPYRFTSLEEGGAFYMIQGEELDNKILHNIAMYHMDETVLSKTGPMSTTKVVGSPVVKDGGKSMTITLSVTEVKKKKKTQKNMVLTVSRQSFDILKKTK